MLTINCQSIKKYNGAQLVLENVTFELHQGEKVGLVGRNGSGKSTLLRMISKLDVPDEGLLTIRKDARIGYLEQIPAETAEQTVYDIMALGYQELITCRTAMAELEKLMSEPEAGNDPDLLSTLLKRYSELQETFEREDGYELDARIDQVANGLHIEKESYSRLYSSLSGGEKTKVGLASQLIRKPDLLLLDEPTNHLDLSAVEWLEEYLIKYEGAVLVVSHDRYFLDQVVTKIVELEDGESSIYTTNYTHYVTEKEKRLLQEFADYQEQQKQLKKMRETIKQLMEWGKLGGNGKFFRRAASMQKALDRIEKLKRPAVDRKEAEYDMKPSDRSGKRVIEFAGVSKRFGASVILDQAAGALEYGEKVMLVGNNGSGKSTLLKLILGELQADEGQLLLGSRVSVGYLAQQQYPDDPKKSVLNYFREQAGMEEGEARSRLASYLFYGADVFKSVSLLSGGEWTRLRLALLVLQRPNLLILDEPTNHMDIASREALEEALTEFPGTILAVTHDRYLINKLSQKIWELEGGQIHVYLGDFDSYKEKSRQKISVKGRLAVKETFQMENPAQKQKKPSSPKNLPQRDSGQLEQEIAELEQKLSNLDDAMNELTVRQDLSELEQAWAEREAIQQSLKLLYECWMEESEG
ncbi:ribosomal protection-like ABC-F family protein [Cohnella abietis]|uniref:ABC transporter ATP-binding protein n=1 Tax=Cohnella abietis TaxID=2507935 RepID=A0A3T1DE57_9BACL|nr:ABC-F type ribosomal protection protein [Cohnella abietis]BBI36314.1 ABC transporter ATP-binding protein [Cohnella abietis]